MEEIIYIILAILACAVAYDVLRAATWTPPQARTKQAPNEETLIKKGLAFGGQLHPQSPLVKAVKYQRGKKTQ